MCELRSFFDWYKLNYLNSDKPWLVLGKGPTFEKYVDYDMANFNVMSLNHVVQNIKVDVAHIIDLDVVNDCQEALNKNAKIVVMPWVPHINQRPTRITLNELVLKHPFLTYLAKNKRLFYYHHIEKYRFGADPLVDVFYFSSEAAIDLLSKAGASKIRTLGIDGGNQYGSSFAKLANKTLLANGRKSFNKQFSNIAKTILNTGVDMAPLDVESPIKVFVATTEEQMLAVKVLEYSIRKHASMSVQVIPLHMNQVVIPQPLIEKNRPRTPFSFQRFIIPALTDYQGKAIYLDSDMQVFKDIKLLWDSDLRGANLLAVKSDDKTGRRPQFSVMLLDCNRLDWNIDQIVADLDTGKLTYESLMYDMEIGKPYNDDIPTIWNCLEWYKQDVTALLHYTDMSTQPWVSRSNPLAYLWFRDLLEMIDLGLISVDYIQSHVEKGFIRPSLLYQVENRLEDPLLLPKEAKLLDEDFEAAFTKIHAHGARGWTTPIGFLKAIGRKIFRESGVNTLLSRIKAKLDKG